MKFFTGIDIVEIDRFRSLKNFQRAAELVLSPDELQLMGKSRDCYQFLASRFALKEAMIKALPEPASLADLEILTINARPEIIFRRNSLQGYNVAASLSHTDSLVFASVVVTTKI
jgi:phosphopantetheine--protein transferase-like protein